MVHLYPQGQTSSHLNKHTGQLQTHAFGKKKKKYSKALCPGYIQPSRGTYNLHPALKLLQAAASGVSCGAYAPRTAVHISCHPRSRFNCSSGSRCSRDELCTLLQWSNSDGRPAVLGGDRPEGPCQGLAERDSRWLPRFGSCGFGKRPDRVLWLGGGVRVEL